MIDLNSQIGPFVYFWNIPFVYFWNCWNYFQAFEIPITGILKTKASVSVHLYQFTSGHFLAQYSIFHTYKILQIFCIGSLSLREEAIFSYRESNLESKSIYMNIITVAKILLNLLGSFYTNLKAKVSNVWQVPRAAWFNTRIICGRILDSRSVAVIQNNCPCPIISSTIPEIVVFPNSGFLMSSKWYLVYLYKN